MTDTDTDLSIGMHISLSSCAITGIEGTAGRPQSDVESLCIHIHHRRMSWILGQHNTKTVMINDVLFMTRKHLATNSFKHQ
jgi:hypothetical protein